MQGQAVIDGATVSATEGAVIDLPGATGISFDTAATEPQLLADGVGSRIQLPNVTALSLTRIPTWSTRSIASIRRAPGLVQRDIVPRPASAHVAAANANGSRIEGNPPGMILSDPAGPLRCGSTIIS